jgi:hypothetical protein
MKKIFVIDSTIEINCDTVFKALDWYLTKVNPLVGFNRSLSVIGLNEKVEFVEWHSIEEDGPPPKFGWYLGALNPVNHEEAEKDEFAKEGTNAWRKLYGTTKVWYNPDASGSKWWEADPHGPKSIEVGDRITHWASIPECPML